MQRTVKTRKYVHEFGNRWTAEEYQGIYAHRTRLSLSHDYVFPLKKSKRSGSNHFSHLHNGFGCR